MSLSSSLLDIYTCCVCLDPLKRAVSLNCGHEVNRKCAKKILRSTKRCPICQVDVNSFKPAFITRQATQAVLNDIQQSLITIHVQPLQGKKLKYIIDRNSKAISLFKCIYDETNNHPTQIRLIYNHKLISPFKNLKEYFLTDNVEFTVYMHNRISDVRKIANDFPEILRKAQSELNEGDDISEKFLSTYKESIDKALQS